MYDDPPAPVPYQPGETPPSPSPEKLLEPGGQPTSWIFNPEYQKLVDLWLKVLPMLEQLTQALDTPVKMAQNTQVWDAPVAERYVNDLVGWNKRLSLYRQAVLTAISDEAADTPRWIPNKTGVPRLFS
jgi:hypothetical protein